MKNDVRFGLVWRSIDEDEGVDVEELFVKVKYGEYFYVGRLLCSDYFKVIYGENVYDDIMSDDYEDDEKYNFEGYEKCNSEEMIDWIKNGCK